MTRRNITVLTEEGERPLILDADYPLYKWEYVDGKQVTTWTCPVYKAWKNMFNRVYKKDPRRPNYQDVTVCDDWFTFSKFKEWYDENSVEGYTLDKDLIDPFAKRYSPETCVFIPYWLNVVVSCSSNMARKTAIGTSFRKETNRYSASVTGYTFGFTGSRKRHIGYYDTEAEAHREWLKHKHRILCNMVADVEIFLQNQRLAEGMKKHASILAYHLYYNLEFDGIYTNHAYVLEDPNFM